MTAYELASLHAQVSDNINAQLTNWMAVFSIYLGAGYLIAHRITRVAAIVLSGVFLAVLGAYTRVMYLTMLSFVGVSHEIRKLAEQSNGLEWHQAVATPAYALDGFPIGSLALLWLSLLGAVYFFFSNRGQHLKSATPA